MADQPAPTLPTVLVMSVDDYKYGATELTKGRWYHIIHDGCRKTLEIGPGVSEKKSYDQWLSDLVASCDNLGQKWNYAIVTKNSQTQDLQIDLKIEQVSGIENLWHHKFIDLRELIKIEPASTAIPGFTATYYPVPLQRPQSLMLSSYWAIMANSPRIFVRHMRRNEFLEELQTETDIYEHLSKHDPGIAPRFLGHVHEQGTVIGFAYEMFSGCHFIQSIEELSLCKSVLPRLRNIGLAHYDFCPCDFIIGEDENGSKAARLRNFQNGEIVENGTPYAEEAFRCELECFQDFEVFIREEWLDDELRFLANAWLQTISEH